MYELLKLINSHVRHDVLNDLTTVRSILEVYQDTKNDELLESALQKIDSSADFLKEMREVESMVSKGELKPLKLSDALKPIHDKYKLQFNVEGDCTVMADDSLTSIFDNLVRNAVTHGNANRIDIKVLDKGDVCQVEVTDNGEGIPEDIRDNVFEEGVSSNGTGLGLYIVKKTIERYGGSIHLKDGQQGTTFTIVLKTPVTQKKENRDSGIEVLGEIGWGTHICHFYQTKDDLLDFLIPYFKAGLENNEYCIWVTSEFSKEEAQKLVKDRLSNSIEVISYENWYKTDDTRHLINSWGEKLNQSLANSYDGLRVAGDFAWLDSLKDFIDYEGDVHKTIDDKKMIAVCSYPFNSFNTSEIADLTNRHHCTLVIREGEWELIENFEYKRTQNVLQKMEERYRALVENANESIVVVQDEKIVYVNSKAMEASGYSQEEMMFKPFFEFIHPDDREFVFNRYKERLGSSGNDSYQFRFISKSGEIRWAEINITSVEWDGKQATLNLLTDITDQKEAEMEKNKLLKAVETTKEAIAIISPDEEIVYSNKAFDELHGYEWGELIGEDPSIFNTGSQPEEVKREIIDAVRSAGVWEGELRNVRKDGSEFISYATITAVTDDEGSIVNFITTKHDITEKKRAEERTRHAKDMLQNFIDTSPLAIIGLDENWKVNLWNPAAEKIFGWRKEEVLGCDNPIVPEDKLEEFQNWHKRLFRDHKLRQKEVYRQRKDGSLIPVQLSTTAFTNPDGSVNAVAIIADISEKKEAEEELEEKNKRYELALYINKSTAWEYDIKTGEFYFDPLFKEHFDFPEGPIRGEDVLKLVPAKEGEEIYRQFMEVLKGNKEVYDIEHRVIMKDGARIWVASHGELIKDENGNPQRIIGIIRDITNRKEAEEELKRRTQEQKLLLDNMDTQVWYLKDVETYGTVNKAHADFFGFKHSDLEDRSLYEIVDKSTADVCVEGNKQVFETKERIHAEEWVENAEGEERLLSITKTPKLDEYGEVEYVVCTADDITERRRDEEALRESEEKYRALVENTPDIVIRFDREFRHLYVSSSVQRVVELKSEEFIGKTHRELGFPEEQCRFWEESILKVFETGESLETEFELERGGRRSVFNWRIFPEFEDGEVSTVVSVTRDVTEEKEAEESAREYRRELETLMSNLPGMVYRCRNTPDWTIEFVSEGSRSLTGYEPWEIINDERVAYGDLIHPEDREAVWDDVQKTLQENEYFELEYRITTKDGEEKWVWERGRGIFDDNNLLFIEGFITDITERKQAEKSLKESEEKYRAYVDNSPVAIFIVNKNGDYIDVNDAACEMLGYTRDELLQTSIPELDKTGDPVIDFEELKSTGEYRGERQLKHKDGSLVDVDLNAVALNDGSFMAFCSDITEKKSVRRALLDSEKRFRELYSNISSGVAIYEAVDDGKDFVFKDINISAEKLSSVSREEVLGERVTEVFPGVRDIGLLEVFQRVWETGEPEYHPTSLYKDNRISQWVENYVYKLPTGEIVAVYDDVTERKRYEEALRESEEKYRDLVENVNEIIFSVDSDGLITYISSSVEQISGYKPQEILNKAFSSFIHPADLERMVKGFEDGMAARNYPSDFRVLTKGGGYLWMRSHTKPIKEGNRIAGLRGVLTDVTELKKAEVELRKLTQFQQNIIDNASVWLDVLDENGNVTVWNKAAEKISGYAKEEVVGHNKIWEWLYPDEDYRNQILEKATSIIEGESIQDFETTIRCKDGQERIILWYSNNLTDDKGETIGSIALGTDVTEQRTAEEERQRYIRELRTVNDVFTKVSRLQGINEICQLLAESIHSLNEDSYVAVSLYDRELDAITLRALAGLEGESEEVIKIMERLKRFTGHPSEMGEEAKFYTTGKLEEVSGGLYGLLVGKLSQEECQEIEELLDINSLYTVGFALGDTPYGGIIILNKGQVKHQTTVETIAGHFSVILHRRQAENLLEESESRYRATFEHTGTAMIVIEEDTTISMANRKLEEIWGYSKEEIEGKKSWKDFVHPDDLDRMLSYHKARRKEEDAPNKYEFRLVDREGNIRNVFVSIDLIPGTKKSVASLLDVTYLRKLNRLLRVLSDINEMVARIKKPEVVLDAVCKNLRLLYDDVFTSVIKDGEPVMMKSEGISAGEHNIVKNCPLIKALENQTLKMSTDNDLCQGCAERVHNYALSIPLIHEKQHGIITIHSNSDFSDEEITLLRKLASNIAFALSAYEVEQDKVTAMEQLAQNLAQFDMAADRLRNPLAVIMSALELKDTYGKDEVLETVQEQSERIKKELDELRKEESATHELIEQSKRRD